LSTSNAPARSPLIAVALSLAATGLGQIYCGRIVRGLVIFLSSLLFAPATVVAALLPPATVVLVGLILALLTVLAVLALLTGL
jgi:signal peptidase I